jgi:hypothetical protein
MTDLEMLFLCNLQVKTIRDRIYYLYHNGHGEDAYHLYKEFDEWFKPDADVHHIPYLSDL